MPSPQDGKAGTIVPPAAPTAATNADDAQPGVVEDIKAEQRQTRTGKYGSVPCLPYKGNGSAGASKDDPANTTTTSWIEVVLVDEDNQPVPGQAYEITLPDNTVASGTLDNKGFARVEGFQPGQCKVTFPDLDQDAWEAI